MAGVTAVLIIRSLTINSGPFLLELLHQLSALGLVDSATVASLCPNLPNEFHPKMQSEAQEHGSELEARRFAF